ncbi:MAG: DUF2062 domain-containing protein [Cyanobacteriota bacterium]|nr:DUF2062 domain-containing protein [Cyanobacteriota bacterium]
MPPSEQLETPLASPSLVLSQSPTTSGSARFSWSRWLRYYYLRLIRLQSTPEAIGRGLAVGVFAGSFPIFGLQTLVAILLAMMVRGNKLVAAAGTWISNPLTYVPFFVFNYQVGQWILGSHRHTDLKAVASSWQHWQDWGGEMVITMFLGCAVVGLILGVISYFVGVRLVQNYRQRRLSRSQRLV